MVGELPIAKIKRYSAAESRAVGILRLFCVLLIALPVVLLPALFLGRKNDEANMWTSIALFMAIYVPVAILLARFIMRKTTESFDRLIIALADLVHESATPLSNITSSVQAIGKPNWTVDPAELQEMQIACDRLLSLHQDLRVISMWGAPLKRSELSILPPALLIDSCKKQLARSFASRHMDIEFNDEGGPSIIADASAIKRVLLNLLENSLKYSEPGSKIVVCSGVRGDNLLITLRDHGPGIPNALLNRVFDRHFRVRDQDNQPDKLGGSGLGLAIAKEIVEAHHGTLTVKSLEPKGVEFSVLLPKVPKQHPFVQIFQDYS